LAVTVWDDGPGIPRGPEDVRFGVGLSNTLARLQQTYGEAYRFELRNATSGGFEVSLWMPFEVPSRTASRKK
jgi:sensor histidine kinase YesM